MRISNIKEVGEFNTRLGDWTCYEAPALGPQAVISRSRNVAVKTYWCLVGVSKE